MASPPFDQPITPFDQGFMVTIGIVVNNDRCVITAPCAYDGSVADVNRVAQGLILAVATDIFPFIVPLITSDAYISYVQAEGFYPGNVPARADYSPTDHPGTGSAGAMPSQVNGMIYFYQAENTVGVGRHRIRLGKTFIPGIPRDQVVGDTLVDAWATAALDLASAFQVGFTESTINPSLTWYRILSKLTKNPDNTKPVLPDTDNLNAFLYGVRRYVVTQRRRLIPR